jgi:hypothetical protein
MSSLSRHFTAILSIAVLDFVEHCLNIFMSSEGGLNGISLNAWYAKLDEKIAFGEDALSLETDVKIT